MDYIDEQNIGPSAQIPSLGGARLDIIASLKRNESYYQVAQHFAKLAAETEDLPDWMLGMTKSNRTSKYLGRDVAGALDSDVWQILHTIPRDILCSVVLGTVIHDTFPPHHPSAYKGDYGIGVYIIGLGVEGRDGKWLTANELTKVINGLEKYMEGYEAFTRHGGYPLTDHDVTLHDFVMSVDSAMGKSSFACDKGHIKFIHKDSHVPPLEAVVRSLQKRVELSLVHDPSGRTAMIETPAYTSCSAILEGRMPDHSLTRNLCSSNKSYGLIVSLMRILNYPPASKVQFVTKLWDVDHLSKAEALIGAPSNCYITQEPGDFNRVECGDAFGKNTSKSDTVRDMEARDENRVIMGQHDFMSTNLAMSLTDIQKRLNELTELGSLRLLLQPTNETIPDDIRRIQAEYEDMEALLVRLVAMKEDLDQKHTAALQMLAAKEDEHKLVGLLSDLMLHIKQAEA